MKEIVDFIKGYHKFQGNIATSPNYIPESKHEIIKKYVNETFKNIYNDDFIQQYEEICLLDLYYEEIVNNIIGRFDSLIDSENKYYKIRDLLTLMYSRNKYELIKAIVNNNNRHMVFCESSAGYIYVEDIDEDTYSDSDNENEIKKNDSNNSCKTLPEKCTELFFGFFPECCCDYDYDFDYTFNVPKKVKQEILGEPEETITNGYKKRDKKRDKKRHKKRDKKRDSSKKFEDTFEKILYFLE